MFISCKTVHNSLIILLQHDRVSWHYFEKWFTMPYTFLCRTRDSLNNWCARYSILKRLKEAERFWNWKTRLVFIIREWFDGKFFAYYCRFNCGLGFSWWWTNTKIDWSSCLFKRSLYRKNVLSILTLELQKVTLNKTYKIRIRFNELWLIFQK